MLRLQLIHIQSNQDDYIVIYLIVEKKHMIDIVIKENNGYMKWMRKQIFYDVIFRTIHLNNN